MIETCEWNPGRSPPLKREQVAPVRRHPSAHAVDLVQVLAPSAALERGVRHGERWRHRLLDHRVRDHGLAVDDAAVEQRDNPSREVLHAGVDGPRRRDGDLRRVVRLPVQLRAVAPLRVRHGRLRPLEVSSIVRVERDMPSASKIRRWTNVSHVSPLNSSTTWPAAVYIRLL